MLRICLFNNSSEKLVVLLFSVVACFCWFLRSPYAGTAYVTLCFRRILMFCSHKLTWNFLHENAVSLLCQASFVSFFHAHFSYYLYCDIFPEFPRWNQSLPFCTLKTLFIPSEQLSSYWIVISSHVFFSSLGSNLLEAEVIIYLSYILRMRVHSSTEMVGGQGKWEKWEDLLSFNKILVMIPPFYYPEKCWGKSLYSCDWRASV